MQLALFSISPEVEALICRVLASNLSNTHFFPTGNRGLFPPPYLRAALEGVGGRGSPRVRAGGGGAAGGPAAAAKVELRVGHLACIISLTLISPL